MQSVRHPVIFDITKSVTVSYQDLYVFNQDHFNHSPLPCACRAAVAAREELLLAERRLGLCSNAKSTGSQRKLLSGPALQLGSKLQEAYSHLWKLQLSDGWLKLKVCTRLCFTAC